MSSVIVAAGRLWRAARPLAGDAVLAAALVLLSIAGARLAHEPWEPQAVALFAPLAWRRRFPVSVLVLEGLLVFAASTAGGTIPSLVVQELALVLVVAAYTCAAHTRRTWVSLPVIVLIAGAFARVRTHVPLPAWSVPFLILGCAWLGGDAIRRRQERAVAAEQRAAFLQAEQQAIRSAALRDERARIARELHDVVTHRVSVMVLQAGAARQAMQRKPERAADALHAVEAGGREALNELRGLLGLLIDDRDETPAPLAPPPGLAALPGLVDHVRAAGLPVQFDVSGEIRDLSRGLDLAAYRIVQEALTNSLRHSGRHGARLALQYGPAAVDIEVTDDGPSPEHAVPSLPGRGLAGMAERAAVFGGTIQARPRPEGGFAVVAHLPIPAVEDAPRPSGQPGDVPETETAR